MKALYRKYRPKSLSEVVGQEQVTEVLAKSLKAEKISHAYLFVGPRGCGKTSVARILAHEINGFPYQVEDNYIDIIEIDGASNRGIDNIRELREKVLVAPTSGKYKVYIIDEVHMLTKEAFNALLKTLEEPPEHAVFIMATTDAYKVPVTITSRAQTFTFKLANSETMFNFLKNVTKKEKIRITDDAIKIIIRRGGGSFRDSLSLLDQISTLSEIEITKDLVISAMGLPQDEKINELLDYYTTGNVVKITTLLKDLLSSGVKPETLAEEMISKIVDNPKIELLKLLANLPDVKAPFAEAKLLVALTSITRTTNSPSTVDDHIDKNEKAHPEKDISDEPNSDKNMPIITFDWNSFVEKVKELNDAIYSQLSKSKHQFSNNTLHIYPERKVTKTILSRENNKRILREASGGVKITIHEVGDTPEKKENDKTITRISDIMGGEVKNDAGGNPF